MTPAVGGVDGARGAWVLVVHDARGWSVEGCADFADVVVAADAHGLVAVGVDMPIGLPDAGGRAADTQARALLGGRRSTLFPTPVAAVLEAGDYADALARSRAASGKGLSKQAFNLLPMIRQVRGAIAPGAADRFLEVHPETTFTVLAGHTLSPKKTAAGVGERLRLLAPHCADLTALLAAAPGGCAVDDVLDAAALAVSAARFVAGDARIFGGGTDRAGYPLRIVA